LKRVSNYIAGLLVFVILLFSNIKVSAQQPAQAPPVNRDSIARVNKQRADSLKLLRAYKESKHYKDSVEAARQKRFADQKAERDRVADSLHNSQKRIADSIMQARTRHSDSIRHYNDSIKTARTLQLEQQKKDQQRRTDSLAAIRKYKESKRYQDSVTNVRETRKKEMVRARLHTSDSLRAIQKTRTDSIISVRKAYNDSMRTSLSQLRAVRTAQLDSMKLARAARADSMAKVRQARTDLRKQKAIEKEKAKADKLKLALELKIKKKQAAYNNQDMRKKKWTLPRQAIQNTFTRYNYYFNANKKMQEAVGNMVRSHVNNYDTLISLFPFNPDLDSNKLTSDMDTIIRKASLGIQIHDPRAKWQDDLYLLLGEAFYYKGDYKNAGASFKTIVSEAEKDKKEKEKNKSASAKDAKKTTPTSYSEPDKTGVAGMLEHRSAENEALLWLSRTLAQSRKEGQAQTVLDLVRNDPNFPERLKGRLALEQAFIDLNRRDFEKAVQSLNVVANDKELPKWLRLRASYLNGQLLQRQLHYIESDQYFNLALSLNPNLEMEFYAKKNIATNSINNGTSTYTADNLLEKMSKDDKFRPYYDQIFYSMGKAALKKKQNDAALDFFKKSVKSSKSNRKQMGLSLASIGDEYYIRSDYNAARNAYDSAAMFLTAADDPVFTIAKKRAAALDLVAAPGNVVKTQDSLIHLASLPEKEQRKIIHDYVKDLERHLRDSIYRAQNNPNAAAATMNNMNNNRAVTWYFANPNLMKQGENEFKQKWGSRTLKDNWRVSSSNSSSFASNSAEEEVPADQNELNLPDEDTLYATIPHSERTLEEANKQLRQGLFDLGKAYYSSLEDYEKATATFDQLDQRFPDHSNKAEELYTRYLIALRQNQPSKAAAFNKDLQQHYPESEWARLLSGENQEAESNPFPNAAITQPKETISDFYDETYGMLMQRQYNDVLTRIRQADDEYKNQGNFRKKFTLMKAVAVAGNGNLPQADTMLRQFISANPNDSLTNWANTILAYIKQQPGAIVIKPAVDSTGRKLPAGTDTAATATGSLNYEYKPASPHYVIISSQANAKFSGLRSGLSDYNLMKNGKEGITVTMSTLDAGRSLIICKEFPNADAARKYMTEIRNVNVLFREFSASEYDILLISADNFPKLFVKKDYGSYKAFYSKNYK